MPRMNDLESQNTGSVHGASSRITTFLSNFIPSRSIKLPTSSDEITPEQQLIQEEPWLNLSKFDKLILFAISMSGSLSCYIICFLLFPVLSVKPRKFGVLWSLGSILFLSSFAVLQESFINYLRSLKERLWFSLAFISTIIMTLISSLYLKNWILSLIFCSLQLLSQLVYTISYFPFGRGGLKLAAGYASGQVDTWINS